VIASLVLPVPEMAGVDVVLIERQMREGGDKELAALRKELGGGVAVETVLRVGRPVTEIIKAPTNSRAM